MHGKTSEMYHAGNRLFDGIPSPFSATRYHSLIVDRGALPPDLEVIAWTEDGIIMGLKHSRFPVWGVQFHPESILTSAGKTILRNFLSMDSTQSAPG
jgi:anthranilate/para-aminobenzoate synthase component II